MTIADEGPYNIGTVVELVAEFTNVAGNPADPTTVTFLVRRPDGTVTEVTNAKDGAIVGRYIGTVDADQSSIWTWKAVGTGTVAVVREKSFLVDDQIVGAVTP